MLVVELNRANFEYDVNSIVRAFYPEEQVHVLRGETRKQTKKRINMASNASCTAPCARRPGKSFPGGT